MMGSDTHEEVRTMDELTDEVLHQQIAEAHEALKERRVARLEAAKTERRLKWQQEVYAPQLVRASDRLTRTITPLMERRNEIHAAIAEIDAGEITTFALYPPRKRKQVTEEEAT